MRKRYTAPRHFAYLLCIALVLLLCGGCRQQEAPPAEAPAAQTVTVADSAGRRVEIPYPVTRAAVSNNYTMEMIGTLGAWDAVCAVDFDMYNNNAAWTHPYTMEQVFANNQRNVNFEKTIELSPQVVILPDNGVWREAEEKLAPFGIKVLVVNPYYADEFADSMTLLGQVFGKEERARQVADYFTERMRYIETQLEGKPRKTVYVEYNPTEETTIPGDFFYGIAKYSGGKNIFDDAKAIRIDLEEVTRRNPDYMVIISDKQAPRNIIPPTEEQYRDLLQRIAARPGWDEISAVKNGRVLLVSMTGHEGAGKLVGAFYAAKFLYPEELPDLHPEAVFKQWVDWQGSPYRPGHTYPAFSLDD
ncbi:ABC transporter substrate-binding protein [Selenomonas sp. F0473]|uniref:ABC transporter substrate-binding protein n=1 Tax=Selenomonas sp. F0473 TaxID=999423 RepID=UPI00029EA5DB|nr:ABC transporter substrate-binding protein [Selenomonas sp. F0473]EKU71126.1 hypothetical protein HMPREF9161_01220 [Selenomonas sp. F0473]